MTRDEIRARITRARRRKDALAAEAEELDGKARMDHDPDARAGYRREYDTVTKELDSVKATIREDYAALEALCERLTEPVVRASHAVSKAQEELLDAECNARDAGEMALADQLHRMKMDLCVGLGQLSDSIASSAWVPKGET